MYEMCTSAEVSKIEKGITTLVSRIESIQLHIMELRNFFIEPYVLTIGLACCVFFYFTMFVKNTTGAILQPRLDKIRLYNTFIICCLEGNSRSEIFYRIIFSCTSDL